MTERTKHLALAFHEVKEANDSGEIFLRHVPGTENTPDLLTKPLPRDQFQKFSRRILNDYWLFGFIYSPSGSFVVLALR